MGVLSWTAILVAVAVATAPCFADSNLTGPVEVVNEPIAVSYGELDAVDGVIDVSLEYFKNGKRVRHVDERLEAVIDARMGGR